MARFTVGPLQRALILEQPDPNLDILLEAAGLVVHRHQGDLSEDALIALMNEQHIQVVFKRSRVPITARVVESCPDLFVVQLCCIGDDSVDKQACADHGVLVFNDPISNGRSVAELAIGHIIALSRRLYQTDQSCRAGFWDKTAAGRFEIKGKVLGVLGLGNIGRQVARAATALGMEVLFHDSRETAIEVGEEFGWRYVEQPEELFRCSDAVSVHLSAQDTHGRSNRGALTGPLLRLLAVDRPAGSPRIFMNLSRGFLHTPEDLISAVDAGAIHSAAVDVYPQEPASKDATWSNPYKEHPQIAVTPHIGAATQEAQPRIARRVAQTFLGFSTHGRIRDCVFMPRVQLALPDGVRQERPSDRALLVVAHGTARGTKRAIDDAIFRAGASNLSSAHRDIPALNVAVDLAVVDRPMPDEVLVGLAKEAASVTGDDNAIRNIRQVHLP